MRDERDAWMLQVEPRRYLAVRDDVDVPHPRREPHHRPDRVFHLVVVGETTLGNLLVVAVLRPNERHRHSIAAASVVARVTVDCTSPIAITTGMPMKLSITITITTGGASA